MNETEFVPTKEAARLLGITPRTIYTRMNTEGREFPEPKRFGRALVWSVQDLKEWRERHPARRRRTAQTA